MVAGTSIFLQNWKNDPGSTRMYNKIKHVKQCWFFIGRRFNFGLLKNLFNFLPLSPSLIPSTVKQKHKTLSTCIQQMLNHIRIYIWTEGISAVFFTNIFFLTCKHLNQKYNTFKIIVGTNACILFYWSI